MFLRREKMFPDQGKHNPNKSLFLNPSQAPQKLYYQIHVFNYLSLARSLSSFISENEHRLLFYNVVYGLKLNLVGDKDLSSA